jgi:hypothetical protein
MAKDTFSPTQACAAKTLFAVMQEMKRRGGSMPVKELYPYVEANVPLTEWEKEPAGKMGYIRWTNAFQFYSIDYVKAGFLQKKNGFWYLTPEGDAAISKGCDEMMRLANAAYDEWKRNQDATKPDDEPTVENPTPAATTAMNLELLESDAHEGIKKYVAAKGPYEFQEIVAALLRAMGLSHAFYCAEGERWRRRHHRLCGSSRRSDPSHQGPGQAQARYGHRSSGRPRATRNNAGWRHRPVRYIGDFLARCTDYSHHLP